MKRLLITLLLAVLSTSAMAEWVQINANNNSTTYVDPTTIRKVGNKVKIWLMEDVKTMQISGKYKFLSDKSQHEYDCQNETFTPVASALFSGNMGLGQVVYSYNRRLDSMSVMPGTVSDVVWKMVCGTR